MESSITDLIVQKEINDVVDNDFTQLGKKIKQKKENFDNLVSNIKNIPYVVEKKFLELIYGKSRPINVKESAFINMVENIARDYKNYKKVVDEKGDKQMPMSNGVSTSTKISEVNNGLDINEQFKEIDRTRQLVQNVKEEAKFAEEEAKKTDEDLNKLSVEQTEVEKKLEDAKIRKEEIKRKVMLALSAQADILKNAKKQYEGVAVEANKRKELNQNKIIEFKNKIEESRKLITQEEREIAEQQELLNALNGMNDEAEINLNSKK